MAYRYKLRAQRDSLAQASGGFRGVRRSTPLLKDDPPPCPSPRRGRETSSPTTGTASVARCDGRYDEAMATGLGRRAARERDSFARASGGLRGGATQRPPAQRRATMPNGMADSSVQVRPAEPPIAEAAADDLQRARRRAEALRLPFDPLEAIPEDAELWAAAPLELLVRFHCVPVGRAGRRLVLAFGGLEDLARIDDAEFQLGHPIDAVVAPHGRVADGLAAPSGRRDAPGAGQRVAAAAARRRRRDRRGGPAAPARPRARSCA